MLVMEEKSLASMATALGDTAGAAQWTSAAVARAALINAKMWDGATGFYYPISLAGHDFTHAAPGDLKRMEIAGLLPLWAGIVPDDRRAALLDKLSDPSLFFRTYGVASLSASDPSFTGEATGSDLWNGPVFVPWQWLVVRGLRAYGETAAGGRHHPADDGCGRGAAGGGRASSGSSTPRTTRARRTARSRTTCGARWWR